MGLGRDVGVSGSGSGRAVAGPEQVADGVGGVGEDLGFEAGDVAGDGLALLAPGDREGGVERQRVPAAGQVGAEDGDDRAPRRARRTRPRATETSARGRRTGRAGCSRRPGDVALEVDDQPVAERRAGPEDPLRGLVRGHVAAEEEPGLRVRAGLDVEAVAEEPRDVLRPLEEQPQAGPRGGRASAGPTRCAPRWLPTRITPRPRPSAASRCSTPRTSNRAKKSASVDPVERGSRGRGSAGRCLPSCLRSRRPTGRRPGRSRAVGATVELAPAGGPGRRQGPAEAAEDRVAGRGAEGAERGEQACRRTTASSSGNGGRSRRRPLPGRSGPAGPKRGQPRSPGRGYRRAGIAGRHEKVDAIAPFSNPDGRSASAGKCGIVP